MEQVHLTEALKDVSGKLDDVLTAAQSLEEYEGVSVLRRFTKSTIGFLLVIGLGYAAGTSIYAGSNESAENDLPKTKVDYKGEPIQIYIGNPDEENSKDISDWADGLSEKTIQKALEEFEKSTGIPLNEMDEKQAN
ncbi:hypothetical protein [Sharpea azabuensis]